MVQIEININFYFGPSLYIYMDGLDRGPPPFSCNALLPKVLHVYVVLNPKVLHVYGFKRAGYPTT